jgi:putative two-component system response regulator
MAERIALYHHERWDGDGYYGLMGEEIPLEARIVSIADAFDVITHERPYKAAAGFEAAMESIRQESGKQFDPALVDALCLLQPMGALVKLGEALEHEAVEQVSDLPWRHS